MFLQQSLSYKNPFWMFLLGSFIVIIFNVIGQLPLTFVIIQERVGEISSQDPMDLLRNIDKNLQLFLLLIPFAAGFIGLWLVLKKLHLRPLLSIVTARKAIDWRRIFFAFLVWTLVTVLLVVGDYFISPESYEWNFTLSKFAILFIIAVLFIPIQTSLEEFIFRGYLMQGFSGLFKNSWAPLLMTSLIFGGLHLFNPEVEKLGYGILVYYIGTGLFLGIMTIMDDF